MISVQSGTDWEEAPHGFQVIGSWIAIQPYQKKLLKIERADCSWDYDALGHALTGISAGIDAIKVLVDIDDDGPRSSSNNLGCHVRDGIQGCSSSLNRPGTLEGDNSLKSFVRIIEYEAISNLDIHFLYEWDTIDLRYCQKKTLCFASCKESITNSVRHQARQDRLDWVVRERRESILWPFGRWWCRRWCTIFMVWNKCRTVGPIIGGKGSFWKPGWFCYDESLNRKLEWLKF